MCKLRFPVVLMTLLATVEAGAQSTERQRERVLRLEQQVRFLEGERETHGFSLANARTLQSGGFVLRAQPDNAAFAQAAAEAAWKRLHDRVGAAGLELARSGVQFLLDNRKPSAQSSATREAPHLAVLHKDSSAQELPWTPVPGRTPAAVCSYIATVGFEELVGQLKLPPSWRWNLLSWYDGPGWMFMRMTTATAPQQRACAVGSNSACEQILAFNERRDSPGNELRGGDTRTWNATILRARLVLVALRAGGPDAIRRARVVNDSTIGAMLVAASGVSSDSLFTLFRADLIGQTEPVVPGYAGIGAGIGFSVLLFAFASRRRYLS